MIRRLVGVLLLAGFTHPALAQCPNGTPPPCGPRRVIPPAANVRVRHFLLLPFRNVTRKTEQDWMVTGAPLMFAQILGGLRDVDVVPDEALSAARRRIGIAADAVPDATQLRKLADETGGWTAVTGNLFSSGDKLRITAQATDIVSSRVLVRAETEIAATEDPREAFDKLAVQLLEPAGVPRTTATLATATTASVDAFRAYLHGLELYHGSRYREAQAEFSRAIALDSSFAIAWSALAAAALGTGGVQAAMDPRSPAYRAAARAAQLAAKLPPREARYIAAIQSLFQGEVRRSRAMFDSLLAEHPENLDVAYWVASTQVLGVLADTMKSPPRLQSDPNRGLNLGRMMLASDPARHSAYQVILMFYGLGGGVLWGDIFGFRHEFGSFAAMMFSPPDVREVPILRGDTIEMIPRAIFDSLPRDEQRRLRARTADRASDWVERWLVVAPEDADAHLWASRIAEVRGDYDRALAELRIADSIGIQSSIENKPGYHLSLLVSSGHIAAAAAMADSMLVNGTLTNAPFFRVLDRRRAFGAAALLLAKRWDSVARLAQLMRPPVGYDAQCFSLLQEMIGYSDAVLPERIRRAVMDTVSANLGELRARPVLAPCERGLSQNLFPR